MKTFEVGKMYSARFVTDSSLEICKKIMKRTAKTVTDNAGRTFHVSVYDVREQFFSLGRYSMAPIMDAEKVAD